MRLAVMTAFGRKSDEGEALGGPLGFRRARADEAALLTGIALAGKQYWGYPAEWMALWRHDLVVTAQYIRREPVQVAERDGAVIGFTGLSTGEDGRYLEHLWLRPECIGRGFGRALFGEAVRMAREEGVTGLRIKADPNAEPFYLKMGAVRTGREIYQLPGAIRREVPLLVYRVG
jgi:GNAT superfamily N-acetyltransferase